MSFIIKMFTDTHKRLVLGILCTCFLVYSFTLYMNPPSAKTEVSAEAAAGKLHWQNKNCASCHLIYGLGGHLGPDLTNVYSKRSPAYITAFLKHGTVTMPDFKLNTVEIASLISFFQNIDSSGVSDPRTFLIHSNGTISQ